MEVSETHDDVQGHGWAQVVTIQAQIPQSGRAVLIMWIVRIAGADLCSINTCKETHVIESHRKLKVGENVAKHTLNVIVVEVKLLQIRAEQRNSGQLVMGQMQIHDRAHVEHHFGKAFVTELVVVKSHKGQVCEILEIFIWNLLDVISV